MLLLLMTILKVTLRQQPKVFYLVQMIAASHALQLLALLLWNLPLNNLLAKMRMHLVRELRLKELGLLLLLYLLL